MIDRERRMIERRIEAAKSPTAKSPPLGDCTQSPARQRITGNLLFDEWTFARAFGPVAVAGSPFGSEHLTHHVNILERNGESCRLGQSKARKDKA